MKTERSSRPSAVLICHEGATLNHEGIARWLASFSDLRGIVVLRETLAQRRQRVRREVRRLGVLRFADVVAMRAYYAIVLARGDRRWIAKQLESLRSRYPDVPPGIPTLICDSPNRLEVKKFIEDIAPDFVLARCKQLIRKEVFSIPRHGTFVFHPGICPEYRNAHGCLWALANDDLDRVGMTLLRIDPGVDTGPAFGYFSYRFDEVRESHIVIQLRVVFDNLDALRERLMIILRMEAEPMDSQGRSSAVWGQPWLTRYLRWRWRVRRRVVS